MLICQKIIKIASCDLQMLDEYTLDIIITLYTIIVAIFFWFSWRKRPDLLFWFIALVVYSIGNIFFIFKQQNELFRYVANSIQLIAILIVITATFLEYISIMKKSQSDKRKVGEDRKFLIITISVNLIVGTLTIILLSIFSLIDALILVIMIMIFLITPVSILFLKIYAKRKTITRLFMFFAFLASIGMAISTIFGLKDLDWGWAFDYAFNFIFVTLILTCSFAAPIEKRIKDSEEMFRKLSETLERKVVERTKQLEIVNKELEAFSYSVSHDLKAPLRNIAGFSKAIWEDYANKFDETNKNFLERIMKSCEKMDELIDDLLKLAQISQYEFNVDNVSLSELATEIMNDLLLSYPEHQVKFIIQENMFAKCDAKLIHIVLENLLGNALKFSAKTPNPRIEFGTKEESNKTIFFVKDNGVGFDMKYYDKIFGVFQRLHPNDEFEGTGIGLATVKRIIQRHNGTVWGEGEINKGAIFYFTLN